jgi:hypothetical protein
MHIAIELNQLRITHIHPLGDVVSGLVYLESAKLKHVLFDNTDAPTFLDGLTTLELNQLYHNTTGADFPLSFDDLARRDALAQVISGLQVQKVDQDELAAQIDFVSDQLEAPIETATQFKYVFGAKVPNVLDGGLFPIAAPPANADQLAQAAQLAKQRRTVRAAAPVPAPVAKRHSASAAGPRAPSGGARPTIWAHADQVWEAAGKPMNPNEVLVLRKRMMVELEEQHGIKKSTSSTALGDWMKARLAK